MSEQHLNLLPEVTRALVGRCVCQAASDIARVLVEVTWHCGVFGQHFSLKAQPWQSDLLDRYNRVPSLVMPERGVAYVRRNCTSSLPCGQV